MRKLIDLLLSWIDDSKEIAIAILRSLPIYFILIIGFYFSVFQWPTSDLQHWREIREVAIQATGTAVFLGIIYTIVLYVVSSRNFITSTVKMLSSNSIIFRRFSKETQQAIIKNTLSSMLGEKYGGIVYHDIVFHYLHQDVPLKTNYRYQILCRESLPKADMAPRSNELYEMMEASGNYIWFEQEFEYVPNGDVTSFSTDETCIALTFNEESYVFLHSFQSLFFRTFVRLRDEHFMFLESLKTPDLKKILQEVFSLKFWELSSNAPLDFDVFWREVNGQSRLKYLLIVARHRERKRFHSGAKIRFIEPRIRSLPYFDVVMSTPIQDPQIIFIKSESIRNLQANSYFSPYDVKKSQIKRIVKDETEGADIVQVSSEGWIFPTSGVMFVWQYK